MIFISDSLYLTPVPPDLDPRNGVILHDTIVRRDNIEASSETVAHPLINLANSATNLFWRANGVGRHTITIHVPEHDVRPLDGVGLAGTNFASAGIATAIHARDSDDDEAEWVELIHPVMRPDDGPVLFRGPRRSWREIRITMEEGTEPPEIPVLYVGEMLVLSPGITADHTPIVDGLVVEETVGRSVAGDFLGGALLSEHVETSVSISHMEPAYYRERIRPFVQARRPFFFAWSPITHPREVGFVWFPQGHSPRPVKRLNTRLYDLDFNVEGVVR